MRHWVGRFEAEEAHERQAVRDEVLAAPVGQPVHRLQQLDLERQHVIDGGPATLRTQHRPFELHAGHREIHQRGDPLKVIALERSRRQAAQPARRVR